VSHPLIQYAIQLVNDQLKLDAAPDAKNISLLAKWAPREKSSFGWLYESLACDYFREILETATTDERQRRAVLKCKTQYRKLLSSLNTKIDTTQVKQCGKKWSEIDFAKVTSITIAKQKKAFLNKKKDESVRFPDDQDRVECSEHFQARIKKAAAGEVEMKGKRVGMADFTKQACELLHSRSQIEIDLLNSQWRDNSTQTGALGNMVAMVDVSGSMEGDPMNVAIALGIRIAEKSVLGKRVMTFSSKPTWVNLDPYPDFVSMVGVVKRAEWGMNTNFEAALDMNLDAIIQNKMPPEDVQNMILVVLSDMQMDAGDSCDKKALYEKMDAKYAAAGIRVHGKPYKPPHILFWNLRSTGGFPSLSSQANCSMMSGFSPALLNFFCEQGIDALQSCTPWSVLEKTLENERYKIMADRLEEEIEV
jgi:Mg-chelatase subunit ChlD